MGMSVRSRSSLIWWMAWLLMTSRARLPVFCLTIFERRFSRQMVSEIAAHSSKGVMVIILERYGVLAEFECWIHRFPYWILDICGILHSACEVQEIRWNLGDALFRNSDWDWLKPMEEQKKNWCGFPSLENYMYFCRHRYAYLARLKGNLGCLDMIFCGWHFLIEGRHKHQIIWILTTKIWSTDLFIGCGVFMFLS